MQNVQHDLLPLVVQENNVLVDAQLLHKKLGVKTKFADWIKSKISRYGFEKGKDYFSEISEKLGAGRKSVNYFISIDMAKELSMLEENETGRQIRRYFIAKEKELRGVSHLPKEVQAFKGLKVEKLNGRKLLPYRESRVRCGYSLKGSCSHHRSRYPQHFVLMGNILYITEEFATHMYRSKQVVNNRTALKEMQPVLALNFGEGLQ